MYAERALHDRRIVLIISLALHIILLALLFSISIDHELFKSMPLEQQKREQNNHQLPEIAALKPRASSFGVPKITFQSSDDETQNTMQQQDDPPSTLHFDTAQYRHANVSNDVEAMHDQQTEEKNIENVTENNEISSSKLIEQEQANTVLNEVTQPLTSKTSVPKKEPIKPKALPKVKKVPPVTAKKASLKERKLTFADLACGFLQSICEGGQDFLKRDGDPHKKPEGEELKCLTYAQRLVWYMQNEWRVEQDKLRCDLSHDLLLTVVIRIMRDGSLRDVNVIKPSGNSEFDSFLIAGIKRAAPYPAVPNFIKDSPFELVLSIHHQTAAPYKIRLRSPSLLKHTK